MTGLGLVSLFADMVADGGKALYGPLLGSLGASALIVGLVTGAAEATSLLLRLVAGPLADAKGNHWSWTIGGYALTAVCIPLLAVTPSIGAAGVIVASTLIILERVGKAFRSPSKSALLAQASRAIGAGRGFGVHKALDMIGAVSGPLIVAAVLAWRGQLWLAFAVLVIPGAITMAILFWLRRTVPNPSVFDPAASESGHEAPKATTKSGFLDLAVGRDLPRSFFVYAVAAGLISGGLVSWGIVSFHLQRAGMVPLALIPVVFAGAMGVGAMAALGNGWAYDRIGTKVLLIVPLLTALVPALALGDSLGLALLGMAVWGMATGIQDSTIKAVVAKLVPQARLAGAYGVFAAIQGVAALVGGIVVGALYDVSRPWLIVVVAVGQAVALVLLIVTETRAARTA
ncbi:MFS transporter [Propionibacteriaceae bacterium G1746]|uniref:MFS transporter n=1 Tax=Aestuariimicrobium sp. G57 TaxID=3418485 RepID=UPI003C2653CF